MKALHVTLGLFVVGCGGEKEEDARCTGETIICTIAASNVMKAACDAPITAAEKHATRM